LSRSSARSRASGSTARVETPIFAWDCAHAENTCPVKLMTRVRSSPNTSRWSPGCMRYTAQGRPAAAALSAPGGAAAAPLAPATRARARSAAPAAPPATPPARAPTPRSSAARPLIQRAPTHTSTGGFGDSCSISRKLDWKEPVFPGECCRKLQTPLCVRPYRSANKRASRHCRESHCRIVLPLIHFIPDSRRESVPLFLKRPRDGAPGSPSVARQHHATAPAAAAARPAAPTASAAQRFACSTSPSPRVRSRRRFRNRGTDSLRESSVKWMSGSTKRQCDRASPSPGAPPRARRRRPPAPRMRPRVWSHCRVRKNAPNP
jgi:hypothetical protein